MRSKKDPSLFTMSCLSVVIIFLSFTPIRHTRSEAFTIEPSDSAALGAAAEKNAKLQFDLNWTFGSKTQHGWYLYKLLIEKLINSNAAPETSDFARALAVWQKSEELDPTGILDQQTWMKMVAVFQSRRIKDRSSPPLQRLTLVPPSRFFDPERPENLRYVERQAYEAYKKLVAAADTDLSLRSDESWLKIISAFRSPAYQAKLRRQNPRSGRAGLAIHSPHSTGRALDIYVGGLPVSTEDQNRATQVNTRVYQWLVKNAERFGFYPYFYEPWHWEYCGPADDTLRPALF